MEKNGDDSRGSGRNTGNPSGTVSPSDPVDGGGADLDELLRLLSERRRRYALYWIRERDVEELDVLARRVAAELAGTTPDTVEESHREEIETMLVHADIPALAATDVVSYDRRTETLRLDHLSEPLEAMLDTCATLDDVDSSASGVVEEALNDLD